MAKNDIKNVGTTEEVTEVKRSVKKQLDENMLVECMNMTDGLLSYKGNKTGELWVFHETGDVDTFTVGELKSMNASFPRFLREPWLLILDDEVVEYLKLSNIYANILRPEDLDKFFTYSDKKISDFLIKAPKGVKEMVAIKAKALVDAGTITFSKVRAIEEALKTKLTPVTQ